MVHYFLHYNFPERILYSQEKKCTFKKELGTPEFCLSASHSISYIPKAILYATFPNRPPPRVIVFFKRSHLVMGIDLVHSSGSGLALPVVAESRVSCRGCQLVDARGRGGSVSPCHSLGVLMFPGPVHG